jgi:hypothetical protein
MEHQRASAPEALIQKPSLMLSARDSPSQPPRLAKIAGLDPHADRTKLLACATPNPVVNAER